IGFGKDIASYCARRLPKPCSLPKTSTMRSDFCYRHWGRRDAVIEDAPKRCLKCGAPMEAGRPFLPCLLRLGLADNATVTEITPPGARFPERGAAPRVTDRIDSYHLLRILGE